MGDIRVLIRSLRGFDRDDVLVKAVRDHLRAPVPVVRARIKAVAVATLPHSGGLGAWVAGTKITALVTLRGKAAGIRLRGGRRSAGGVTDVRAIDRGRVRAPSWGRRGRGQWHTQAVPDGFFTRTAAEAPEWERAIDAAIAEANGTIHG
jgi:hypothetical protein